MEERKRDRVSVTASTTTFGSSRSLVLDRTAGIQTRKQYQPISPALGDRVQEPGLGPSAVGSTSPRRGTYP
ncbi:hypothetical protein CRG98_010768 [Punica granatum]|uniref:Uncharacterized protein n=1 Tax=Punica granatum TaxID=22663 RepID=A0A2I0KJP3_PUNGR|nr:hypothetical protein CRG98_010768 [Punica granatum]